MRLSGIASLLLCLGSGGTMGCGAVESDPDNELEELVIPDQLSSDHIFTALSADGRFAASEDGTILELPAKEHVIDDQVFPRVIRTFEDEVWVAGDGVWSYDGMRWQEELSERTTALALGKDGQPCALIAVPAQVRCRTSSGWTSTPLPILEPDVTLSLNDMVFVDEDTIWVLGSYMLGGREEQPSVLVLEGDTWTERRSDYALVAQYAFLPTTHGAPPYVYAASPGPNPILDPSNNWTTVLEKPDPLFGSMFGIDERWWSNGAAGLYAVDEAGVELAAETLCRDLARWDHDTVVCANWEGGLSFITRRADGTYETVTR